MRSVARRSSDFPPTFRTATLLICHFLGSACVRIYRQIVSDIFSLPEYLLYQTVSADKPLKLVYTLRIIRLPILLICYIDYTYVRYIRSFCFFLWLFLKLRIRSQHMNWTELNWTRVLNTMLSKVVNGVNTTRWTLRCSVKCNTAETFRHTETQTPSRKHGRLLYQETKVIFIVPEDNAYN